MLTNEKDFCTGCGWLRPIVSTKLQGEKDIKLCATCAANPDIVKALDATGVATDVMNAFGPLTKGMVDVTEKTRALWNQRQMQTLPPGDTQDAAVRARELRQWFRRGVLLGALMATGIAFAFFNFIRGWG